jgi:hypothetical protein
MMKLDAYLLNNRDLAEGRVVSTRSGFRAPITAIVDSMHRKRGSGVT